MQYFAEIKSQCDLGDAIGLVIVAMLTKHEAEPVRAHPKRLLKRMMSAIIKACAFINKKQQ